MHEYENVNFRFTNWWGLIRLIIVSILGYQRGQEKKPWYLQIAKMIFFAMRMNLAQLWLCDLWRVNFFVHFCIKNQFYLHPFMYLASLIQLNLELGFVWKANQASEQPQWQQPQIRFIQIEPTFRVSRPTRRCYCSGSQGGQPVKNGCLQLTGQRCHWIKGRTLNGEM